MMHTKKPISVLVMKQPDGKYKVTDRFNKVEIFSPEEFYRYVDSKVTAAPATSDDVKDTIELVRERLADNDVAGAINILETIL